MGISDLIAIAGILTAQLKDRGFSQIGPTDCRLERKGLTVALGHLKGEGDCIHFLLYVGALPGALLSSDEDLLSVLTFIDRLIEEQDAKQA